MYDTQIAVAILERLGEVIRDLTNHPGKGLVVAELDIHPGTCRAAACASQNPVAPRGSLGDDRPP